MRLLLPLLLCVACVGARFDEEAERQRWFERLEFESRDDEPELLIVWDNRGRGVFYMEPIVQFALWSDGQAIWCEGDDHLEPSYRAFRCTAQEVTDLRVELSETLPGQFLCGPGVPCAAWQHVLWREQESLRGVSSDESLEVLGLEPSRFGQADDSPTTVDADGAAEGWARLSDSDRVAVRARLAIEAAVTELVARHPEAEPTSAVRLVVP